MSTGLSVVFAGTPDFAVPSLAALLEAGHTVRAVYTQPDRPAGRGRQTRPSPVKVFAETSGLPVRQPETLRSEAEQQALAELAPDCVVVAAYGLILPSAVLEGPPCGCVNVHASLLPRWRGPAPIQRALLAGDSETGISIMRMARGVDTGPVLARQAVPIHPEDTAGSLHDRLAALGAKLLVPTLAKWAAGAITPEPQDEAQACHAPKVDKSEARLDWSEPAASLARKVRAFDPWPVAWTPFHGKALRVWRAVALPEEAGALPPGTVVRADAAGIDVVTGAGLLRLLRLQPAGRTAMGPGEFLNGRPEVGYGFRFQDG